MKYRGSICQLVFRHDVKWVKLEEMFVIVISLFSRSKLVIVWMCRCMCMYVLRVTISAEIALLSCLLDTCMCYYHFDLSWAKWMNEWMNEWLIDWLIDWLIIMRTFCEPHQGFFNVHPHTKSAVLNKFVQLSTRICAAKSTLFILSSGIRLISNWICRFSVSRKKNKRHGLCCSSKTFVIKKP